MDYCMSCHLVMETSIELVQHLLLLSNIYQYIIKGIRNIKITQCSSILQVIRIVTSPQRRYPCGVNSFDHTSIEMSISHRLEKPEVRKKDLLSEAKF